MTSSVYKNAAHRYERDRTTTGVRTPADRSAAFHAEQSSDVVKAVWATSMMWIRDPSAGSRPRLIAIREPSGDHAGEDLCKSASSVRRKFTGAPGVAVVARTCPQSQGYRRRLHSHFLVLEHVSTISGDTARWAVWWLLRCSRLGVGVSPPCDPAGWAIGRSVTCLYLGDRLRGRPNS